MKNQTAERLFDALQSYIIGLERMCYGHDLAPQEKARLRLEIVAAIKMADGKVADLTEAEHYLAGAYAKLRKDKNDETAGFFMNAVVQQLAALRARWCDAAVGHAGDAAYLTRVEVTLTDPVEATFRAGQDLPLTAAGRLALDKEIDEMRAESAKMMVDRKPRQDVPA